MGSFNGAQGGCGTVTIVGGGIAGLVAAICCAEGGASVRLLEAHDELGGRGRNADGPYRANLGPHAMYARAPFWDWLKEHDLLPDHRPPQLMMSGARMRIDGEIRRTPPLASLPGVLRLRGRQAPSDVDFRSWAERHTDARTAAVLSGIAGVYTFHHDPGELAADFVWSRTVPLLLVFPSSVRYPTGGWTTLIDALAARVRALGVEVCTGERVSSLPEPPVIVATELAQARELLGEPDLDWCSGRTVCLDLGLEGRRGDPWIVSDTDEAGWVGRYSTTNPTVAPDGEELIQAQMPIRPGESVEQAAARLERLLDQSVPEWRGRVTWRRRQLMDGRSGALDMPGQTWRDRPAVDRGDGVFLAGDMVAAPGLLAEVAWGSAVEASELALAAASSAGRQLRRVA